MTISSALLQHYINGSIWCFVRIGAMLMVAPIFSDRYVSPRLRILLTLAITLAVAPTVHSIPSFDLLSGAGMTLLVAQMGIGIAMGFVFSIVFQAFLIGGQIVAMQAGLGFATMNDPAHGGAMPVISQFYLLFLSLVFLSLNGHTQLIYIVAHSFKTLPLASNNLDNHVISQILNFSFWMFQGAVLLSLPAIISLLIVNLAFGVMTRTAPQLNIISIGFPITLTLGICIIYLSMNGLLPHCENFIIKGLSQTKLMVNM